MTAQEQQERDDFVRCALTYVGTPYHNRGMLKGVGVDCATLLVCAGQDAGLIGEVTLPQYSAQWHLHRGSEKYLATILNWAHEVDFPALKGDIILWRFGRSFSHAAIVIEWPRIVHAYMNNPVRTDDALANQTLRFIGTDPRPTKLFSRWSR